MPYASKKTFLREGIWYCRIKTLQPDGTTRYGRKGGFHSEQEAAAYAQEIEKEYKRQLRKKLEAAESEYTLKGYLIHWRKEIFPYRTETTTQELASYVVFDLLLPCIGENDIPLKMLTVTFLNNLLSKIAEKTALAGNTVRTYLYIALNDALREGFITHNPMEATKTYPRPKPTVQVLSKDGVELLLKGTQFSTWYPEILLGLFCGLRKGEILGLKFSDIDFEHKTIHVQRQLVYECEFEEDAKKVSNRVIAERPPKTTNSDRFLPVPNQVLVELQRRKIMIEYQKKKYGKDYHDYDYVSCQENGLPHYAGSLNNFLSRFCKKNFLPHISVHSLRHMFATVLLERGLPLFKISGLLGHCSVHTTFEYYAEVMDENERILSFMNNTFVLEKGGAYEDVRLGTQRVL